MFCSRLPWFCLYTFSDTMPCRFENFFVMDECFRIIPNADEECRSCKIRVTAISHGVLFCNKPYFIIKLNSFRLPFNNFACIQFKLHLQFLKAKTRLFFVLYSIPKCGGPVYARDQKLALAYFKYKCIESKI